MYGWAAQAFLDDDLQSLVSLGSNANHGGVWSNHLAALHEFKKSRKMRAVQFDLQVRPALPPNIAELRNAFAAAFHPELLVASLVGPRGRQKTESSSPFLPE